MFWMFQYEASHPTATQNDEGWIWHYACSQAPDPTGTYDPDMEHEFGVLPWTGRHARSAGKSQSPPRGHGWIAFALIAQSSNSNSTPTTYPWPVGSQCRTTAFPKKLASGR